VDSWKRTPTRSVSDSDPFIVSDRGRHFGFAGFKVFPGGDGGLAGADGGGASQLRYLHVGGLVAMGFDPSGEYLLTISHSGRGVFSARSWERVARDPALAYPENGYGIGIGPIAGVSVAVQEMNYQTDELSLKSPDGAVSLKYETGMIAVSANSN
jgi:hypothetical protein